MAPLRLRLANLKQLDQARVVEVEGTLGHRAAASQEARSEEENLQVFHLACLRVETDDNFVGQFLGLLLRVRWALVDVEDIRLPIIFESQLRLHSTSPWIRVLPPNV
jgi:hypothetical protein